MARKDRRAASSRSRSGSSADKKSIAGASDRSNNTADTGAASRAEDVNDILNYDAATSKPRSTTTTAAPAPATTMVTSRATYSAFGNDAFDATATDGARKPAGAFDADALLRLLGDEPTKTNATTAMGDARDRTTTTTSNDFVVATQSAPRAQVPMDIASNNGSNDADGDATAPEYSFMFVGKDNNTGGGAGQNAMTSGQYSGVADVGSPGSVAGGESADSAASRARRARRAMELRAEALRAAGVDIDASGDAASAGASAGSQSIWRSAAGARAAVPPVYPTTPQNQQQPSGGSTYEPVSPGSVDRRATPRSRGTAPSSVARSDSSSDSRVRVQYQQGDAEEIQSLKDHRQGNLLRLLGSLANTYLSAVTGFKVVPTYPLSRRITRCVVGEGISM